MLVKEALMWGILELEDFTSKQLESRILLANILKTTQEGLLIRYNEPISQEEEKTFYEHIDRKSVV